MVCVANSNEVSALEMNVPMSRMHTIWPTEVSITVDDVSELDPSRASSCRGSSQGEHGPVSVISLDPFLREEHRLLEEEVLLNGDRRGVRSVLSVVLCPCAAMTVGPEKAVI